MIKSYTCKSCSKSFEQEAKRGRPPSTCPECKMKQLTGEKFITHALSQGPEVSGDVEPEEDVDEYQELIDNTCSPEEYKRRVERAKVELSNMTRSKVESQVLEIFFDSDTNGCFIVHVNNKGNVYCGSDIDKAIKTFKEYVNKSSQGFGQVGFENVKLSVTYRGGRQL